MSRIPPLLKDLSLVVAIAALTFTLLAACSPAVGSKEWCEDLKAKPKGEWTANEAGDFAKHCVL
jgi:hypothetical protein